MIESYDHSPDMGPEECSYLPANRELSQDKKSLIPFPIALKDFLVKGGYILDPSLYLAPRREQPPSAPVRENPGPAGHASCAAAVP